MADLEDSGRVKAFRRELVKSIKRFPNDRASLQALEAKSLTELLIRYIGWRTRFVGQRKRRVTGRAALDSDPRAVGLKANIDALAHVVEAGGNLDPYLSEMAHDDGYTPAADPRTPNPDLWKDKDLLLNVMGLHHFHLGMVEDPPGRMKRTNAVLFASVSRDEFEIIGLFDHAAFKHEDDGSMTPERQKLWGAYLSREASGLLPGQLSVGGFAGGGVAMSGEPNAVVQAAIRHVRIMRKLEPILDDLAQIGFLFPEGEVPAKPKLRWRYHHLDFGLFSDADGIFRVLEKGPN